MLLRFSQKAGPTPRSPQVRRFYPVPVDTTCTKCGTDVPATPEGETYSRQTVVTFDDSPVSATYCSNRCVNEDDDRLSAEAFPVDAEVREVKAPTKRAALVARYVLELKTQEQVSEFTAQLRREAGAQDVSLLPETTWAVKGYRNGTEVRLVGGEVGTGVLLNTMESAEDVSISWPSLISHWGVLVRFTWGGVEYIAKSSDYQLTETYLSS